MLVVKFSYAENILKLILLPCTRHVVDSFNVRRKHPVLVSNAKNQYPRKRCYCDYPLPSYTYRM